LLKFLSKIANAVRSAKSADDESVRLTELNRKLEQSIEERTRELRSLEHKFRNTFEQAAIGMAHLGLDGKWLLVNPRFCSITGYSQDELRSKTFADITHPEDIDKDWELATQLANGEIPSYEMEKRYLRKDGSIVWIKLSVSLSRAADGEAAYYISSITDITAEHEARAEAERERSKIVQLFQEVPAPIAIYEGPEHRIALANPEYLRQTGQADIFGRTYAQAFPLAEEQGHVRLLDEVFKSGTTWSASEFPISLALPDGTVSHRFLNATLQPYRDSSGRIAGLINLGFDVTEQVQSRHRLEETDYRLQLALKAANMGVWEWDIESGIVKWDEHMPELFGGPGATFSGTTEAYSSRIYESDRKQVWATINAAIESKKDFEVEHRVVWDEGSVHWILGRGRATYDAKGKPAKILGVALDIDSRKEAEEAITSSEERFRTLFEQSPLSIEIHAPDGALVRTNESWRRLWNIPFDHIPEVMRTYNVLKDQALEKKGIIQFIRAGFAGSFSKTPPVLYDPADVGVTGRPRWIETHISPILNSDGSLSEVAIIHEDITERKEAEEAILAAKEAAEAANQAKTQFLANMSHEIRTPLGAMLGFAQLMLDDESASETQKNSLRTITRNGEQLYRLINELLDISKVESNKLEVEKSKFDLEEVIRDVTALLSLRAEQKGVEFSVETEGLLPATAYTDPVRFRQILMNVIGNAVKFTEKGKVTVVLKLRDKNVDGVASLEVKVQDTGIGIPSKEIPRLFQPFVQADQANSRKFGGSGLGLYLSKKFAQGLGGDLELVEAPEGKGSIFIATVDIGRVEEEPSLKISADVGTHKVKKTVAQNPSATTRLDGVHVLVVDDSPDNLELTKRYLSAVGAKVEIALGAKKAFEFLSKQQFDVIVMDIQMPEIDGYQAVRRLRNENYRKPIIALTAHAMKGERERCLDAGFDGYLVKPIDRVALVNEIKARAQKT
jgi:PAS domain S-box-containing protein